MSKRDRDIYWLFNTDNPTCPYCEHEETDYWEWGVREDEDYEVQCENCEKTYFINLMVRRTFKSYGDCAKNNHLPHQLYKQSFESAPYVCQNCFLDFYDWQFPNGKYPKLKEGEFVVLTREEVQKRFPLE